MRNIKDFFFFISEDTKERHYFFYPLFKYIKCTTKNWLQFPAASRLNPRKAVFQPWRQQAQQAAERKTITHESLWLIRVQLHLAQAFGINPMSRGQIRNLHSYCQSLKHNRETRRSEQALSKGCRVAMGQHTGEGRRVEQLVLGTKLWKDLESCGGFDQRHQLTRLLESGARWRYRIARCCVRPVCHSW